MKDKTYAELKGDSPFDWHDFLDQVDLGEADVEEMDEATCLAADWVTCACGNQCAALSRDEDGEPMDPELKKLGIQFFNDVETILWAAKPEIKLCVEEARDTLRKIEERSAFLLRELNQ